MKITEEARETLKEANLSHYGNVDTVEADVGAIESALRNIRAIDNMGNLTKEQKEGYAYDVLVGLVINVR